MVLAIFYKEQYHDITKSNCAQRSTYVYACLRAYIAIYIPVHPCIYYSVHNAIYYICVLIVVVITRQPENTTVCRGGEVTISCGHNSTAKFDTIWSINGSNFHSVVNDPLYQHSNQTLTIFSIKYATTFRCAVNIRLSSPIILISTTATVTVVGMYKCIYVQYVDTYIMQAKYGMQPHIQYLRMYKLCIQDMNCFHFVIYV